MHIQEKKELCSKLLISWFTREKSGYDMSIHDSEIANTFIAKMLIKKFDVFDVDIVLPDELILMLDLCCDLNPGIVQIVLADLLGNISKRLEGIPKGHIINTNDFTLCFSNSFPIMNIESINSKYKEMWDNQKKIGKAGLFESDNLCDTSEYWLSFMRKEG